MEENKKDRLFGLLGQNISYSFSREYFREKFQKESITDCKYVNFDISKIDHVTKVITDSPNLFGLNVTIPYKQSIIPYLDSMDADAMAIGAVNTIKIDKGHLRGYNTDCYGFETSLKPYLKPHHQKALILGRGGASKAIAFILNKLDIDYYYVSRQATEGQIIYKDLNEKIISTHTIIVNCSPVGTHPNTHEKPNIPYQYLTDKHLLYDLVYNPLETAFLRTGIDNGTQATNGLQMLHYQAEKSWEIWNSEDDI